MRTTDTMEGLTVPPFGSRVTETDPVQALQSTGFWGQPVKTPARFWRCSTTRQSPQYYRLTIGQSALPW